jgi:hypothetical protein
MKMRIICKYEGGESLSAIALGLVLSTVITIAKDAAAIKGTLKAIATMKSMITKKTVKMQ